jgi:hypothetical protein
MRAWGIVIAFVSATASCALIVDLDALHDGVASDGGGDVVGDGSGDGGGDVVSDVKRDVGTYIAEVQADYPSSWWRLGESNVILPATDENGDLAPGTYRDSGVTVGVTGALSKDGNTAARLDGVTGAVTFSPTLWGMSGLGTFTIELWVKPNAATTSSQTLLSHRISSEGWWLFLDPTLVPSLERIKSNSVIGSVKGSKALATNQWTYLVVTGDGSTLLLYIDGVLDASGPTQGSIVQTTPPYFSLGASSDLTQQFFAGDLDEVAIYGPDLSAARILVHYQAGTQ